MVNVTVNLPRECSFEISLDPAQFSQGIMLAALSSGQLYEVDTSAFLIDVLRPGDTAIDIGAHVGWFSLLMGALVGPAGRVLAAEPNPANQQALRTNLAHNGMNQVKVIDAALADTEGEAALFVNADNDGGHALWDVSNHPFNAKTRENRQTVTVPVTTLDIVVQNAGTGPVRVIKMDAEGAEGRILAGGLKTLAQTAFVIAEMNETALQACGSSVMDLRRDFLALGFEAFLPLKGMPLPCWLPPETAVPNVYAYNLIFARPATMGQAYPFLNYAPH